MQNIQIEVRNLIAAAKYGERIVSDNAGYTITFDFDEEWNDTDRTARFIFDSGYIDVPFSGDTVFVPMLPASVQEVKVGVYSGSLQTTTAATITVVPSCLGSDDTEYIPATDTGIPDAADLAEEDTLRIYDKSAGKLVKATLKKLGEAIGGEGGGISTTAKNLLITILRSGVYTADQSNNITALDTALGGGTTEPEEPDVPVETTYAISNELINCTSSNRTTSVKENAAYSTTLTANDGYTLTGGTVTVTMGGVDITSTAYADGVISIASVTGDVEIFASAVVVQAEAALPEDGLISYFDFRTTTYDNVGSGGKTTIAPTKGSGHLYIWANNSISMQNEYGLNPANTRNWTYDQNGGTNETALGDSFTVIQLTYGEAPKFGFDYSNFPPNWMFCPKYINASGSTVDATVAIGSNFNSDNKHDYNFTVFRADGATLTEIFDTSRTTYNGGDIDGFSRWLDTPSGNAATMGDNIYCTAMAIYNRALTDSEIEAAREFMKTLEVTA